MERIDARYSGPLTLVVLKCGHWYTCPIGMDHVWTDMPKDYIYNCKEHDGMVTTPAYVIGLR